MLTPFMTDRSIDWSAYDELIEYYLEGGASGLFATCLSSETPELSMEECLCLSRRTVERVEGRVPVAAGALCQDAPAELAEYVERIHETGVSAVVMTVNQFAAPEDGEDVLLDSFVQFLDRVDSQISLGLYECPYPYHRKMSPALLGDIAKTGRVGFVKDTCSDIGLIRQKLEAVEGTPLQLYNANDLTLTDSVKAGASGYSGVGTNFFCEPYVWRCRHADELSEAGQQVFGLTSFLQGLITPGGYPAAAKYFLQKYGLSISRTCRVAGEVSEGQCKGLDILWDWWMRLKETLR
jgi:4-hydroxy-tetrahydrodipicolinate synthase